MTATNTAVTPVPPPRQPSSGQAATMVRLIRESFEEAETRLGEVGQFFYGMLFSRAPETRELFPVNMEVQRSRLLRALIHVVHMVDRPDDLVPFLRQLGRDHRKFGVVTDHYEALGISLISAVKRYAPKTWSPAVEAAWTDAYGLVAKTMIEAAEAEQGPPAWSATVIEHRRVSWDLAVIRVQPTEPVPYRAGQYVSVETPQRPRLWRFLSPANAPRPDGAMEFHVRAVPDGWVSRAIVRHAQVGDTWRIGSAMGRLSVDRKSENGHLLVGGGTGIAPMRAIVEDLAQYGDNPSVHVFAGARTREDLYDLDRLLDTAATNPWLTITAAVDQDPDAVGVEHGTLADVVTRHGAWKDRDVLVCGSPAMIRATVSRMLVAGTPLDRIRYDPFTLD